jgi:hypothetical protein
MMRFGEVLHRPETTAKVPELFQASWRKPRASMLWATCRSNVSTGKLDAARSQRRKYSFVTPADQPAAIMRLFQRLKDHGIAVTEIIERGYGKTISFLLISVENAPGATRFANGDWTDLPVLCR